MIYEVLYILPSKYSDSEVEGVAAGVATMLGNDGAKIAKSEVIGKLKLAYPIKKNRHGTYVLTYIEADGSAMAKIDQDMRLSDDVVRHAIVKCENGIPAHTFRPTSYVAPLSPEGKRVTSDKPEAVTSTEEKVESKPKISVEELDRKLDAILDTDLGNV